MAVTALRPEDLAGPDSRFLTISGLRVHCRQAGEAGPALVLLHGFGGSLFSWRELFAAPANLGRLFAFDRPAFGLTERRPDWDYTPEAQVDLTIALMDAWELEQAVLVGSSAGGTLALQVALRHPDRVAGLVLVDAAVYRGGGAPAFVKPLLATAWGRRLGVSLLHRFGHRLVGALLKSFHNPARVTQAVLDGYAAPRLLPGWAEALWAFTLASRLPKVAHRLHEIRQPTLVVSGQADRLVPAQDSRRLAAHLSNATYAEIPDCGHLPQEECPAEFLAVLRPFLAQFQ